MAKKEKLWREAVTGANLILSGEGVLFILVWLYFIYYYGWTAQREFTNPLGIVIYYILPAVVATLFFYSLRLKPTLKVNVAILCVALTASLYAEELLLVVSTSIYEASKGKNDEAAQLAKQNGISFDTRDKTEVITALRKQNVDAVPAVFPRFLLAEEKNGNLKSVISIDGLSVLPLGGISNKVTVLCNESGDYTIYKSDEHGFHNPQGIWQARRLDVAALGDSFTHGWCVPSEKNFVDLIRNRYRNTLNLGMESSGPLLEEAELKEFLPPLKPKVVVWFYFEQNDLLDLKKEAKSSLLMHYLESDFKQHLLGRQSDIDQALIGYLKKEEERIRKNKGLVTHIERLPEIIKLSTLRQRYGLIYGKEKVEPDASSEPDGADIVLFHRILLQAKTTVASWGGLFYFVYLPTWERYAHPERASKNRELVLKLANGLGLPVIDLHRTFQSHSDPLALFALRRGWHYNEQGHRVVAEEVLRLISGSQTADSFTQPYHHH